MSDDALLAMAFEYAAPLVERIVRDAVVKKSAKMVVETLQLIESAAVQS